MIKTRTVRQVVSCKSVGDELDEFLSVIQDRFHYKVLNVYETKVNAMQGTSDQGFIVIYDDAVSDE